jgi:Cof subfamily protein (haloacid dehalogenase superfamily)
MAIRLLALDLDGTLLNSRGELSQRNRDAIQAARAASVRVAVVTGRRFRDARPLALELGLDVPVISHNGALTKHARSLETVNATLLPLSAAREVLRVGRETGSDTMVSDDPDGKGVLVYDCISENNQALAKYIAWSRRIHGDEADDAVRQVPSLEEYLDHPPVHISFSGRCEPMKAFRALLEKEIGDAIRVLSTEYLRQDFTLLDVLNPLASKGIGVAAAADEYGFSPNEVMAVGDNYNDLEMLQFAGTGVLMGNADPTLRQHGEFHITASNDEDGVAVAIEQFILTDDVSTTSEVHAEEVAPRL